MRNLHVFDNDRNSDAIDFPDPQSRHQISLGTHRVRISHRVIENEIGISETNYEAVFYSEVFGFPAGSVTSDVSHNSLDGVCSVNGVSFDQLDGQCIDRSGTTFDLRIDARAQQDTQQCQLHKRQQ